MFFGKQFETFVLISSLLDLHENQNLCNFTLLNLAYNTRFPKPGGPFRPSGTFETDDTGGYQNYDEEFCRIDFGYRNHGDEN
jgi:hypothetical protein